MGLFDFLFAAKRLEEDLDNEYRDFPDSTNRNNVVEGDFSFIVEDIFTITGRGTVVTGRVGRGSARVGDAVYLTDHESGNEKVVTITGIEMFRKTLDVAVEGDLVGILLRGITRNEVCKEDILHK